MKKTIDNTEGNVRVKIIEVSDWKKLKGENPEFEQIEAMKLEAEINKWLRNNHVEIIDIQVVSNTLAYIIYYI